jgi:hypothetical protein
VSQFGWRAMLSGPPPPPPPSSSSMAATAPAVVPCDADGRVWALLVPVAVRCGVQWGDCLLGWTLKSFGDAQGQVDARFMVERSGDRAAGRCDAATLRVLQSIDAHAMQRVRRDAE